MILTLISISWLILSLINPSFFKKILQEKANRTHLSLYFILAIMGSFIWFWLSSPIEDKSSNIVWESEPIVKIDNPTVEKVDHIQVEAVPVIEEIEAIEIESEPTNEEIEIVEVETEPVEVEPVVEEIKPLVKNLEPSIISYETLRKRKPDGDEQGLWLEILISKNDATKANIVALVESLSKSYIKKAMVKIYQSKQARNEEQSGDYSDLYNRDYLAAYIKNITNDITFQGINEIRWMQGEWTLQNLSWTQTQIR